MDGVTIGACGVIAGMKRHAAHAEVWVAVAKMFAVIGKKPLE